MTWRLQSMPSLFELQTRFMDALLGESVEPALRLIASPGEVSPGEVSPSELAAMRVGVYRNNVRSNLLEALRSTYPAIWRLVGEEYFRQIARQYHERHPSRSGDLSNVGDAFPAHLRDLHQDDEFSYLAEVARLECLIKDTLLAADHPPLDLGRMAGIAPETYGGLRFLLHPALNLFESPYPAHRIWEANVGGDSVPDAIDLAAGADRLAVLRHGLQLQFHRLRMGEWSLLGALGRGESIAAALEAADASDGEFDASAALQRFVAIQAIVDFK